MRGVNNVKAVDCVDCGKQVQRTQQGLSCDACDFWHHVECEDVTDEVYDFLCEHAEDSSLAWFCKKCVSSSRKTTGVIAALHGQQQHLEERVGQLAVDMSKRFDEFREILQHQMETVKSSHVVSSVETQKRVESKMDALIDTVKTQSKMETSIVTGCVECGGCSQS
jgi:predicted transcriptional regulator YheO